MDISKFLISHTGGEKSLTATCFIIGFIVINIKLFISGISFGNTTMSAFSGVDYGAALVALGGVYIMRRNKESKDAQ